MSAGLGIIDLAVLLTMFLAVVWLGLWAKGKTHDLEGYLLGGRDLPWWAILGSIVATETSTATVLSVPGLGYGTVGMKFLQLAFGYVVGRALVVKWLLPLYFEGRLNTAYQVLQRRFGTTTQRVASLLFLVTRNLGDGLRLFLAALVVQQLVGWRFAECLLVMGLVTIFYTYLGGMRSVVWNDCLQLVVYMVGAVAAVFVILGALPGGWNELWVYAAAHDKLRVFEFRVSWSDPFNFWAGLVGGAVLTIGTHGTDHMMVQRYLSARSQRDAGRAILLSGVVVLLQFAVFLLIGVELACFYAHYPEVTFTRTDRVFAHFLVHHFPRNTGLVGLMLAAILAAAMSTLSSSLNSSASALVHDFGWFSADASAAEESPERSVELTRRFSVMIGLVQIGVGFGATLLTDTVVSNALTIAGFSAGLLLGVYALGVLTRDVSETAALCGAGCGLCGLVLLQFGGPLVTALQPVWPGWTYAPVAWPWLALIGATTTFATGRLLTLLMPQLRETPR